MDSRITAAARALAAGDPLGALNRIALLGDPSALALRGIAMAQLGDFGRAKSLLKRAARGFGTKEPMARARCIVAEAEIALVSRDLAWPAKALDTARAILERHDDKPNAAHARYLAARHLLLIGRLDDATRRLAGIDPTHLSAASRAAFEMVAAGIAMRRLRTAAARAALANARRAASLARIPALMAEVDTMARTLKTPAARKIADGKARLLLLEEVETLLASKTLVVDACRNAVRRGDRIVALAKRPVLFALARTLAEAGPGGASRGTLLSHAFGARHADESHRARLRVEIGRLRTKLAPIADIRATGDGFALLPRGTRQIVVLAPPTEEAHGAVLAFLADGEAWSSSALALALGASQRTVQRSLDALAATGKVQAIGKARARRWMAPPLPGFPTNLLLPVSPLAG
jgi:hypothetical protein